MRNAVCGAGIFHADLCTRLLPHLVFAIELQILPVQGFVSIEQGIGPFLRNMVLPASTLSVVYIALLARITRTSMLEVLHEDHVKTARAKGVPEIKVLLFHGLRNAAVPIVTMIGISMAILISGSVVVEWSAPPRVDKVRLRI